LSVVICESISCFNGMLCLQVADSAAVFWLQAASEAELSPNRAKPSHITALL
jgi:hypothetical protein